MIFRFAAEHPPESDRKEALRYNESICVSFFVFSSFRASANLFTFGKCLKNSQKNIFCHFRTLELLSDCSILIPGEGMMKKRRPLTLPKLLPGSRRRNCFTAGMSATVPGFPGNEGCGIVGTIREGGNAVAELSDFRPDLFPRMTASIHRNFNRRVSLKTLSLAFQVSEETVRRVFQRSGCTPGGMTRNLRFSHARELLRNTSLSVAGLAGCCGFGDIHVFSKAFKRRMKIEPLQFRKKGG